MTGAVVTGTDTGVGKTVVSALLLAALGISDPSRPRRYLKLVQTGAPGADDTAMVARLARLASGEVLPPGARLALPASPMEAAERERRRVPAGVLHPRRPAGDGVLIVEGAGGLLVPLTRRRVLADAFAALGLPLVIVARPRVGTINHTLLTLEAARRRRLAVAAVIFSGEPTVAVLRAVRAFGGPRRLLSIPRLPRASAASVHALARQLLGTRPFGWLLRDLAEGTR